MDVITFTIPGRISGKGRPRAAKRGQHIHMYTPQRTASMEATVRELAAKAMGDLLPIDGPVVLDITINLNTPKSWSKKKRYAAHHVTGKPDLDNIVKLIGDSCNGIVFKDDSQICELHVRRRYNDNARESADIMIRQPSVTKLSEFVPRKIEQRSAA